MNIIWIALMAIVGAGIPVQVAGNEELRHSVKSATFGITLSFAVGSLAALLLSLAGVLGRPQLSGLGSAPWWVWCSGLISALVVLMSVIVLPKLGAGPVIAATVCGQLVAALLLDQFGWLGVKQAPINAWKIGGAVLLIIGTVLMQKK